MLPQSSLLSLMLEFHNMNCNMLTATTKAGNDSVEIVTVTQSQGGSNGSITRESKSIMDPAILPRAEIPDGTAVLRFTSSLLSQL